MINWRNRYTFFGFVLIFLVFGCAEPPPPATVTDAEPPSMPLAIQNVIINEEKIAFATINPNDESVIATILLDAVDATYLVDDERIIPDPVDKSMSFVVGAAGSDTASREVTIEVSAAKSVAPTLKLRTSDLARNIHDEIQTIALIPDLSIENIELPESTVLVAHQHFSLRLELVNDGHADASSSMVLTYYKSADNEIDSLDQAVGSEVVNTLPAKSRTAHTSIGIPVPDDAGVHYYGACIAPVRFSDVDASNNCSMGAVEIDSTNIVPIPQLQLDIGQSVLSVDTDASAVINVNIVNNGGADAAANTELRLIRSKSDLIQANGEGNIEQSPVEIGEAVAKDGGEVTKSLTIPAHSEPGIYYYGVCAAYTLPVLSEALHFCSSAVTVSVSVALPPIRLTTTISQLILNGDARSDLAFDVTVVNSGDVASTAETKLHVLTSESEQIVWMPTREQSAFVVGAIAPNNGQIERSISVPKHNETADTYDVGTHYYGVCASYALPGVSQLQYSCSSAVQVEIVKTPYVQVKSITDTSGTAQSSFRIGTNSALDINVALVNNGELATPANTQLRLVRSTSRVILPTARTQTSNTIGAILADGQNVTKSVTVPAHTDTGVYYYGICVMYTLPSASSPVHSCSSSFSVEVHRLIGLTWNGSISVPPFVTYHFNNVIYGENTFLATIVARSFLVNVTYEYQCKIEYVPGGYNTSECAVPEKPRSAAVLTGGTKNTEIRRVSGSFRYETLPADSDGNVRVNIKKRKQSGNPFAFVADEALTAGGLTMSARPRPTPVPMLAVVTNAPTLSGVVGRTSTIRATVTNSGSGATPASGELRLIRVAAADADVNADGPAVATVATHTIAANGGRRTESLTIPAHSSAGTYYYAACIVYTLPSGSESLNACSPVTVATVTPPPSPMLAVVMSAPTLAGVVDRTSTITATVTNSGNATTPANGELRLIRVAAANANVSADGPAVATVATTAIAASGGTLAESLTIPAHSSAGTYYYAACIVYTLPSSESLDACSSVTIATITTSVVTPPPSSPLLAVVTNAPTLSGVVGSTSTIRATVTNSGSAATPASGELRLIRVAAANANVSADGTAVATVATTAIAANGGTLAESLTIPAHSSAGTYYYAACIVYTLPSSESLDACSSVVVATVTPPPSPLLAVVTNTPTLAGMAGSTSTITATVTNSGSGATPASGELRLIRVAAANANVSADGTAVATVATTAIAANGGTLAESLTVPAHSSAGTYYYAACIVYRLPSSESLDACSSVVVATITAPPNPFLGAQWSGRRQTVRRFGIINITTTYTLRNVQYTADTFSVEVRVSGDAIPYRYTCSISYDLAAMSYTTSNCRGALTTYRGEVQGTFTYSVTDHSDGDSDTMDQITLSKGYVLTR